jgi:hypothetical protein
VLEWRARGRVVANMLVALYSPGVVVF